MIVSILTSSGSGGGGGVCSASESGGGLQTGTAEEIALAICGDSLGCGLGAAGFEAVDAAGEGVFAGFEGDG
jgi:hypothetical protein